MKQVFGLFAAFAAVGAVAGCSVGGPVVDASAPTSAAVDVARAAEMVEDRVETRFGRDLFGRVIYVDDGEPLRLNVWPAVDRAAGDEDLVIVAVHGYGDHAALTYDEAAAVWTAAGATVYAYDQRGFGHNRSRGAWPGAQVLIDDLVSVLNTISEKHPETPLVLIGHSMGGGVSLATVGEGRAPMVDGLVLLAPAVWGGEYLSTSIRALTWVAAAVAPDKRLTGGGLVTVRPTDNDETMRRLATDPFYLKYPSPREYLGVTRLMDRALIAAETLETPVLVMYGVKDEVIPGDAVRGAVAAIPTADKTYVEYEDGWHLLLRDLQGPKVREEVLAWIEETIDVEQVAETSQ